MNKHQIKVFLISLVFQFLISSLIYLGVKLPAIAFLKLPFLDHQAALAAPQIKEVDPLDSLKPSLTNNINSYSINKTVSLVPEVQAADNLDNLSAFNPSGIESFAYGVIDFDSGNVLYSKNLSQKLPIASLTKLMTSIVALDLASPDEIITVNQQGTTPEPSKLFLKVGEKYSVEKLVNFMLIASANDAAEVTKEGINQKYGADIFVRAMNFKAESIGLKNTHFTNAEGLDNPNHYSSVEDLAILSHYALSNYPLIAQIVQKPFADFRDIPGDNRLYLNNWNGLLGVYPGVMGIKIGNTDMARHTDIVLSERAGKKVLAVELGAPTILERDLDAATLLNLGFAKFNLKPIEVTKSQLKEKYSNWKYFD